MKIKDTSYPTLTRAVIRALGGLEEALSRMPDVLANGPAVGFPGFIYYGDTFDFYRRHRKDIVALVDAQSEYVCDLPIHFVAGLEGLRNSYVNRRELTAAIAKTLYGPLSMEDPLIVQVANALAWYALVQVSRELTRP